MEINFLSIIKIKTHDLNSTLKKCCFIFEIFSKCLRFRVQDNLYVPQRRNNMKTWIKLYAGIFLILNGLNAAAMAIDSTTVTRRINCVLERNGAMECHAEHPKPCICFFDVIGLSSTPLNAAILNKLKELKVIDNVVDSIRLTLYGVANGESIHTGWTAMTEEQIEQSLVNIFKEREIKDLNELPLRYSTLGKYVIKVSY